MHLPQITHQHPRAFTLIEIVVVVSIVAILAIVAVPQISGVLTASRLRSAAEDVQNRLLEAQSLAMLFNTEAELRLYETPDLTDPAARRTLRKLRILTLRPPENDAAANAATDAFEPAGAIINLEHSIEISADAKYSSITDLGFQEGPADAPYGRYIALRFRSDGSACLPPGRPWFLTLHEKDAHLNGRKLRNFVTLQIEPATGRLRSFQP